ACMSHGLLGGNDLLQRRASSHRAVQRPLFRANERRFGDDPGGCELASGKAPAFALDREHFPGVRPIGFSYAEDQLAALIPAHTHAARRQCTIETLRDGCRIETWLDRDAHGLLCTAADREIER